MVILMKLLFENKTIVNPNKEENDILLGDKKNIEDLKSALTAYSTARNDNEYYAFIKQANEYHYDPEKGNLLHSLSSKEADQIFKYKHLRNTVSAISMLIIFLIMEFFYRLVLKVDVFDDPTRHTRFPPEVIFFGIAMIAGYFIGMFAAKKKYGNKLPKRFNIIHYNYKIYDDRIVMISDYDRKIFRYKNIQAAEDENYYYIKGEDAQTCPLAKSGFSVNHENFKKLLNDNGIIIGPYYNGF